MNFETIWQKYPKKLGKRHAMRHFKSSIKTVEDYKNLEQAIQNYIQYIENNNIEFIYIMHGGTFFYNWEDWLHYEEPKKKNRTEADVERTEAYLNSLYE